MYYQKILINLALICWASFAHSQGLIEKKWLVDESSSIVINGSSNMSDFACLLQNPPTNDTLLMSFEEKDEVIKFHNTDLYIKTSCFDCQNRLITQDFQSTLQAETHPDILLSFVALEIPKNPKESMEQLDGEVKITIVGVSRSYRIKFDVKRNNDDSLFLAGKKEVSFNDFGLTPPRKLAGLVRVDNELEIDFNLSLFPLINESSLSQNTN